jgi:hypothetical protein
MYSLIRSYSPKNFALTQLPSLVAAFVIAEFFFKWKSFSLECLGFLATWFVLDWCFSTVLRHFAPSVLERPGQR